jgi:methionyl-tRNA formyltransferase
MGSGPFACPILKALLGYNLLAVYTQSAKPSGRGLKQQKNPAHILAEENNIPVYTPEKLHTELETLRLLAPDLIMVVSYGLLLPPSVLEIPKMGCVNLHASLLPRWRGAAPIHRAILANDSMSGISWMYMTKGLDEGPVFHQLALPIHPNHCATTLAQDLAQLGVNSLPSVLQGLGAHLWHAHPQPLHGVSYAHKIEKKEFLLDFNQSAQQVERSIRGFFPKAYCDFGPHRLIITQAQALDIAHPSLPGTIEAVKPKLHIACGNGILALQMLGKAGGKIMDCESFSRGNPIPIGTMLNKALPTHPLPFES